jgi:hypothetical protein
LQAQKIDFYSQLKKTYLKYELLIENESFWDAKTLSRYALCNEFMIFGSSEQIGKTMQRWLL